MQKKVQCLKPIDENILDETIIYELLAVDLTAHMAQCEPDKYVKESLDFALLEDFAVELPLLEDATFESSALAYEQEIK